MQHVFEFTLWYVQNVFIENPEAGTWWIEIYADEINQDQHSETPAVDQDYSLVAYGFNSVLSCRDGVPIPGNVSATPAGDNAIELNWTGSASGYKLMRAVGGCSGDFEVLVGTSSRDIWAWSYFTLNG